MPKRFRQFLDSRGQAIYVDIDTIEAIGPSITTETPQQCVIHLAGGAAFVVREDSVFIRTLDYLLAGGRE